MLATVFALLLLTATPAPGGDVAPGDGLQLSPMPSPPPEATAPPPVAVDTFPPPIAIDPQRPPVAIDPARVPVRERGHPLPPFQYSALLAFGAVAAGAVTLRRRIDRPGDRGISPPPPNMRVVFVPGFGSAEHGTFDELVAMMGLEDHQVVEFDWRLVVNTPSHGHAAKSASVEAAADSLESFLGGLAVGGDPIYLIGHSKGGVAIAELVERWDEHPHRAIPGVAGATLLDPPMAAGSIGILQSIGRYLYFVPNDGGYEPFDCGFFLCDDGRAHLGEGAGVDVLVIRNPDAGITSIQNRVPGLRIYDLEDDGKPPAIAKAWQRGSILGRITEAHRSPLTHPAVAACISAELHATGSCNWEAGEAWEGRPDESAFDPIHVPRQTFGGGALVKVV